MGLSEATIHVPFRGGLETKEDEKTVPKALLTDAVNCIFTKRGTLSKRNGYDNLGKQTVSGGALPAGKAIASLGSELLFFSADKLYTYRSSLSQWDEVGGVRSVKVTHGVGAASNHGQTEADSASAAGLRVFAWVDTSGGVYWSAEDATSGKVVISPRQLYSKGERPRVVACGSVLHIYCVEPAANTIWSAVIDPASPPTAPALNEMVIDLDGSEPAYDASESRDASEALIAWRVSATEVKVSWVAPDGNVGSPVTGYSSPKLLTFTDVGPAIAIDHLPEVNEFDAAIVVVVSGSGGTNMDLAVVTPSFSQTWTTTALSSYSTTSPVRIAAAWEAPHTTNPHTIRIVYEEAGATARDNYVRSVLVNRTAGTISDQHETRGVCLASRAYRVDDQVFVSVVHDSTYFATAFAMRHDGLTVARWLPGLSVGVPLTSSLPSVQVSGYSVSIPSGFVLQLESEDGDVFSEEGIRIATLDFDAGDKLQTAEFGDALYIGGGMLQRYDGAVVCEAGFHYAPDDIATPTEGAGGSIAAGTRSYVIAYEEQTARGEIDRGPVSVAISVTVSGSDNTVTFSLPTYRLTAKQNVRIGVWRTVNGDTAAFYRVSSLDPAATGNNGYVDNDTTVDTVSFVDGMSDADLLKQEPLYTNGGILPNNPVAGGQLLTTGKNRIFQNDPSSEHVVQYSQELAEGYAAEMTPRLRLRCDPYGGAITGLVVMDDALIIFKERAIYFSAGPGPTAAGTNASGGQRFSEPQLITSDVGCQNQRSIGYTPQGVLFQSTKGIYLLGRDRSVSYVGASVEAYNSQTIRSTDLIADKTQIRFLTDSGSTLLYDYERGQWSRFSNHEGVDAQVIGGTYHYLRNTGEVWQESSGYADDNKQIKMRVDTAWLHFTDWLQGWQTFWHATVAGTYKSDHDLRIYVAYDYSPNWEAPIDIDIGGFYDGAAYGDGDYGAGVYGGAENTRWQQQIHLGGEGQAIRFRFEDVEPTGSAGASFELNELIVNGGALKQSPTLQSERMG